MAVIYDNACIWNSHHRHSKKKVVKGATMAVVQTMPPQFAPSLYLHAQKVYVHLRDGIRHRSLGSAISRLRNFITLCTLLARECVGKIKTPYKSKIFIYVIWENWDLIICIYCNLRCLVISPQVHVIVMQPHLLFGKGTIWREAEATRFCAHGADKGGFTAPQKQEEGEGREWALPGAVTCN